MIHLGDITKINGAAIEPVSVITFGSPCQDLSVAGKRAGLKHGDLGDEETTRSGLFMEATRIIKEMRKATDGQYPKACIWENVVGAYSSNSGYDFHAVLVELARCTGEEVSIPMPDRGKWEKAGTIILPRGSIAWRTMDAQHWGVPQRRRRIAVLLLLDGDDAARVLFECRGEPGDTRGEQAVLGAGEECGTGILSLLQGLPRHPPQGISPWEGIARNPQDSAGGHDSVVGIIPPHESVALQGGGQTSQNSQGMGYHAEVCYTLNTTDTHGVAMCIGADIYNGALTGDKTSTLRAKSADADHVPCAVEPVPFGISAYDSNSMKSPNPHSGVYTAETSRTLDAAQCCFPACNQGGIAVCAPVIYQTDEKVGTLNAAGYEKNGTQEAMQGLYVVETPLVYDARGNGDGRLCSTLTGDHQSRVTDYTALAVEPTSWDGSQTVATLTASNADGSQRMPDIHNFNCVLEPAIGLDRAAFNQGANAQYDFQTLEEQPPTLTARGPGAVCAPSYGVDVRNYAVNGELYPTMTAKPNGGQSLNYSGAVLQRVVRWIVRRLTPNECCSLQGFPRGWCDIGEWVDDNGKRHKDAMSPKYKALGNSIALPQWWWLMCRLEPYLGDNPTLGSLFDGIGGFPLVFETKYGKGTARWASEIEPFPIAVTRFHFPEPEGWYEDWMG